MENIKISATQVSLPKGGGAIQGIGESFQANEFTGTAALSIPIPTSPCRDFAPHIWILSLFSLLRFTKQDIINFL
ncbi:MAG: hypothetical protein AAFW70_04175 [Cyanobacteria bacterium J06635_10]